MEKPKRPTSNTTQFVSKEHKLKLVAKEVKIAGNIQRKVGYVEIQKK